MYGEMSRLSFELPAGVDEVFALVTDEAHITARCEAFGETNIDVVRREEGDETVVSCTRDVALPIPSALRRVVSETNRVTDTKTWSGGAAKRCDFRAQVAGGRIEMGGTISLDPAPGGARYTIEFGNRVDIAVVGRRIEQMLRRTMHEELTREAVFIRDALAASRAGI